jgi:hypothetical protein
MASDQSASKTQSTGLLGLGRGRLGARWGEGAMADCIWHSKARLCRLSSNPCLTQMLLLQAKI